MHLCKIDDYSFWRKCKKRLYQEIQILFIILQEPLYVSEDQLNQLSYLQPLTVDNTNLKNEMASIIIQDVETSMKNFQTEEGNVVASLASSFMDVIKGISKFFCVSMILFSLLIIIILSFASSKQHFTPQIEDQICKNILTFERKTFSNFFAFDSG